MRKRKLECEMFIAARIANGLSLLALLTASVFALGGEVAVVYGLLAGFYLFDLLLRRKKTKGDLFFAAGWTLLFGYASFETGLSLLNAHEYIDSSDALSFYAIFIVVYLAPFLLNGIYLLCWFFQKKTTT